MGRMTSHTLWKIKMFEATNQFLDVQKIYDMIYACVKILL